MKIINKIYNRFNNLSDYDQWGIIALCILIIGIPLLPIIIPCTIFERIINYKVYKAYKEQKQKIELENKKLRKIKISYKDPIKKISSN